MLCCIPCILENCVFIFVCLNVFSDFLFYFSVDPSIFLVEYCLVSKCSCFFLYSFCNCFPVLYYCSQKNVSDNISLLKSIETFFVAEHVIYPEEHLMCTWKASLVAQTVKHLPAVWETWVWSLVAKSRTRLSSFTFTLERICILLFWSGIYCRYLFCRLGLMCHIRSQFPYWFCV